MREPDKRKTIEPGICVHIFSVSAGMVGVCLTVIGILQIVNATQKVETLADDFLAADAVLFLVSCVLSYWAIRTRTTRRMHRVERFADGIFLVALMLMVSVCGFGVYAITFR
jgi:hypothetical protein